jgi:epoxide hydrolase
MTEHIQEMMMKDCQIEPFQLQVPERDLEDLRDRLARTRWPDRQTVDDWSQGAPLTQVQALCEYWRTRYDWRRCESMLNGLGQYKTTIDGLGIHFLHVRSPEPHALPMIMTHGWPGSIIEFHKVIGALTNPVAHGGDARDAFHLVIPSLPGFGFSDKPTETGWGVSHIAAAWIELMHRLDYGDRWVAQGGDWGSAIVNALGALAPSGCIGLHSNTVFIKPTAQEIADASPAEREILATAKRFTDEFSGYFKEQSTRPQTIGYALADTPAGQAAWIYEKFDEWTDNPGSPEGLLTQDEMLDNIMLYWLPNAGASAARLYWESFSIIRDTPPISLPIGFSVFPKDLARASRRWADRRFSNIIYWQEVERGGHFAALEQPALFVREVRNCFRLVRG